MMCMLDKLYVCRWSYVCIYVYTYLVVLYKCFNEVGMLYGRVFLNSGQMSCVICVRRYGDLEVGFVCMV